MPPVTMADRDKPKMVKITVTESLDHGFQYEGQDYYAGDTLEATEGWASVFINDGWARLADPGAKVGPAAKSGEASKK